MERATGVAQVLPCSKRFCHDWTVCPFAHPGEKARRRDPRLFTYTGIACPDMKKVRASFDFAVPCCVYWMSVFRFGLQELVAGSVRTMQRGIILFALCAVYAEVGSEPGDLALQDQTCLRGDACPYAHNVFEYWLHPTRCRPCSRLCLRL